jgi:hypothetical protein
MGDGALRTESSGYSCFVKALGGGAAATARWGGGWRRPLHRCRWHANLWFQRLHVGRYRHKRFLHAGHCERRALAAAKARGTKLGGCRVSAERFAEIGAAARQARTERAERGRAEILPTITKIQAAGATTLRQIAAELNALEIPAARGGEWSAVQVRRILERTTKAA